MSEEKSIYVKDEVIARNKVVKEHEKEIAELKQNPGLSIVEAKKIDPKNLDAWIKSLYNPKLISKEDLSSIYESFKYHGYDRELILRQLAVKFGMDNQKLLVEVIINVALNGPKRSVTLKLSNGETMMKMGIPASGQQGKDTLSANKILAATADLAAFYLKKLKVPKRMMSDLPGWLQFPSAGSIRMPDNFRREHIAFSKKFSELIGGKFQEQIYLQMQANEYLMDGLRLFN